MTLFILVIVAFATYYLFIYRGGYKEIFDNNKEKKCPNCQSHVEENFNVCPICKETLKKKCPNCSERIDVRWNFCPFCEEPIEKGDNK